MFFETERLFAKELTLDNTTSFIKMQSNANVMKHITGRPKTEKESISELEKILRSYEKISIDFLIMAIVKKDDSQFVGTCAIIKNDEGEHEIGYRFIEKYWGNGYGKEILNGLITFTLKSLNLNLVVAHVDKTNYASVKILDSSDLDFVKEYKENGNEDLIRYYKLLKSEYNR